MLVTETVESRETREDLLEASRRVRDLQHSAMDQYLSPLAGVTTPVNVLMKRNEPVGRKAA